MAYVGGQMKVYGQFDSAKFEVGQVVLAKGKLRQPYWDGETAEVLIEGSLAILPVKKMEAEVVHPDRYDPFGVDNEIVSVAETGMLVVLFLVLCMITAQLLCTVFRFNYD